jgi:hypothetical protein
MTAPEVSAAEASAAEPTATKASADMRAATPESSPTAEMSAATHSATHMAAAMAAAATTARECGCRRHGAAQCESRCKNDHCLTQHDKPPSQMLSTPVVISSIAIGRPRHVAWVAPDT